MQNLKAPEVNEDLVLSISETLGVSRLFARIMLSRGFASPSEAEAFLYPRLEHLSDPFQLPDIEKAVGRVVEAIEKNQKICLYGDYDADGITSVALLVNFLRNLRSDPQVYIPTREEGYGLHIDVLKMLSAKGIDLVICLDCGSTNVEEIAFARSINLDIIVIDHHEPGQRWPAAHAIINPKRRDSTFPTRELAACGVAFFFLLALRRVLHGRGLMEKMINLKKELDLVTVGTVGDMAPLIKDNRILVRFGMEMMRKSPRAWLKSFYRKNIIRKGLANEYVLNFIIIPRINAAGRVSEPLKALDFLVCEDQDASELCLAGLQAANKNRQRIEEEILRETMEIVNRKGLDKANAIVLFKEDWHIGVIGIVAQRLVEAFGKPSIVITEVNGLCKGSGRGGNGVDLHETIRAVSPTLLKFGGHKFACGISLLRENLEAFRETFENNVRVIPETAKKEPLFDAVADFRDLTGDFLESMEHLAPFGIGNPRPTLLLPPARVTRQNKSLRIVDGSSKTWYGTFRGKTPEFRNGPVRVLASPAIREEMGQPFIYLNVKDFIPVES